LKVVRAWLSDGFDQTVMLGLAEQILILFLFHALV